MWWADVCSMSCGMLQRPATRTTRRSAWLSKGLQIWRMLLQRSRPHTWMLPARLAYRTPCCMDTVARWLLLGVLLADKTCLH